MNANSLAHAAVAKARDLQALVDTLNNTTTVELLASINYLNNIDSTELSINSKSLKLIILLKAMQDDISQIQSIDFNKIINLADTIDGKITTIDTDTSTTVQAKDDTLNAISQASLYNPTIQERRYKADFFGIKLL